MDVKKKNWSFVKVLLRDALLCASFIYFVLLGIQLLPFNSNWFQPASNAFKDFDWSDIYYSQIKNVAGENIQDQQIVVVNIGDADRETIANTLLKIKEYAPAVLGLDIIFNTDKDSATDKLLDSAIQCFGKQIVVACYADSTLGNNIYSIQPHAIPKLGDDDNLGYVNFIGDENQTIRSYYKIQNFRERKISSFAFNNFIKFKNSEKSSVYKELNTSVESIIPYEAYSEHYTTLSTQEILNASVDLNLLKGKIVLIGFCGSENGMTVIDDKHFTPLNENYAGKSLPDMYGIYIHANIISGYLNNFKIQAPSRILQIIACILFIALFLLLYLYSESQEHVWQNVVEILLQLFFGLIILILAIYFFSSFGIKWNIGEMIAAIALAEPLVGFYRIIIHYLSKVYSFKSIFIDEE